MADLPQDLHDDTVLVAGLRAGDGACFARVLDAWSPGMARVARAFVSTPDSAAEVVPDAWLAVIEGIDAFAGRSSLKTWVYRILVNTAKRRGRRESRVVPWSSVAPGNDDRAGPTVDPALFQGTGEPFPGHWRADPAPWPEQHALAAEVRADVRGQLAVVAGVPAVLTAVRRGRRRARGAQGGVAARRGRRGGGAAASGPSSRTACGRARR